jgi:hypothetical protein
MSLTQQIAKQLREVHFGGNWAWSCLYEHVSELHWRQATMHIQSFNTIATLVHHMNYYLNAVSTVVEGIPFEPKHKHSLCHPIIESQMDWEKLLDKTFSDAEIFAQAIERMPENLLWEPLAARHGNYYRNILGVIEHNHYHLGQIVQIKKLLAVISN